MNSGSRLCGIRSLFISALDGRASENELEALVAGLADILIPLVRRQRFNRLGIEGYEPKDIALITLASLFVRDASGRFPALEKAFAGSDVLDDRVPQSHFAGFLASLLRRRLKQAFFSLSREIWPERAKVRREIRYAVHKAPGLTLDRSGQDVLVAAKPAENPAPAGGPPPPVSKEDLIRVASAAGLAGLPVTRFVRGLAEALPPNGLPVSFRMADAEIAYLELVRPRPGDADAGREASPEDPLERAESGKRIAAAVRAAEEETGSVLDRYVRKGKITAVERDAYGNAVRQVVEGWLEGRAEGSLFERLKAHWPGLDPGEYRREKRKILEYLVKRSRARLHRGLGKGILRNG